VHARGRSDLTGEDVTVALALIRDLVPADLAAAIESRFATPPRTIPRGDEAPFDVAIRSLSAVVESVDGHGEAGPRPDPKDIDLISSVRPDADSGRTDAPDAGSPDAETGVVFDPTALQLEGDAARPADRGREPLLRLAGDQRFDPDPLGVADENGDDSRDTHVTADRVELTWDDTPEPGPERFEDNVFAFGPPRFDDDDPSAEAEDVSAASTAGRDEPDVPNEPMFKKKSNLTLPTIGVDAADWYGKDEPDSES